MQAQDDLLIEGNVPAPIVHNFTSADPVFDGLSSELSVSVIDNDFQRTLEPGKAAREAAARRRAAFEAQRMAGAATGGAPRPGSATAGTRGPPGVAGPGGGFGSGGRPGGGGFGGRVHGLR